jgi:CRP/FNR family transcriptional regulator
VFEGLGQRLAALIRRLDSVTFGTIDQRLAAALCAVSPVPGVVELTHEALAVELGTVREVVSRHIKRFEELGWLKLMRGRIEILDPDALCRLAEASLCDPVTELSRNNGDDLHQSN